MERTGIAPEGDPGGCTLVALRHADEHVHVVATLAREDGRPPRVWNDYRVLAEVAHTFEDRFGLRSTAGRDDHTADRRGEAERVWREAERIVAEAADRITADAGSDPDGAADAAWAAGDTLAAAGVGGDAGGPLSDAAVAFDRAGRESSPRVAA